MSGTVFEQVQRSQVANRCKCAMREGMAHGDLQALGGGCKMPSFCCPSLALYRRLLPKASMDAQQPDWSPDDSQVRRAN